MDAGISWNLLMVVPWILVWTMVVFACISLFAKGLRMDGRISWGLGRMLLFHGGLWVDACISC